MSFEGDRERGLYAKYEVYKMAPNAGRYPTLLREPFFVLRYTTDPHARAAFAAYANSCRTDYPALAADIDAALARWTE